MNNVPFEQEVQGVSFNKQFEFANIKASFDNLK